MATYQFRPETFGVKWAPQTAYDAIDGSPTWYSIACTMPTINFAREEEELSESRSTDFEANRRVIGSKDGGTMSFQMQLKSQPSSYDPTAADPASTNETSLITDAFGALYTGDHGSNGVVLASSGHDANTAVLTATGTPSASVGEFVAFGGGSSPYTITCQGAVTSDDGAQTVGMFEDMQADPTNGLNVYAFQTFYATSAVAQPGFKTFRITSDQDHEIDLIGCVLTGFKFMHSPLQGTKLEFTYTFTDWAYGTTGGITAPTEYNRIPVLLGNNGARVWIDGDDNSDGTAETTGTCGLADTELDIQLRYARTQCHSANEGISTRQLIRREATLTFSKPWITDDISSARSVWQAHYEDQTTFSYSLQAGTTAGSLVQLLIPAMRVSSDPGISDNEDKLVFTVEAEPAAYSGDGAGSGDPKNSIIRFGLG